MSFSAYQEEDVSLQREELERWRLPHAILIDCQRDYPGVVRLTSAYRHAARVSIYDSDGKAQGEISFYLPKDETVACELQSYTTGTVRHLRQTDPALWGLCKHTAVEAMLAVRNYHRDYVQHKRKAKQRAGAH